MALGARARFARLPGDLVFTNGGGHVVLVVSRRAAIQARTRARVSYVSLKSLQGEFVGARRLLR